MYKIISELTSLDGILVGTAVGLAEGETDGPFDGDREGDELGARVGLGVGLFEGDTTLLTQNEPDSHTPEDVMMTNSSVSSSYL